MTRTMKDQEQEHAGATPQRSIKARSAEAIPQRSHDDTRLLDELMAVDDGRFRRLLTALTIQPECGKCGHFDSAQPDKYRCRVQPSCIAATLHPHLQSYLLWKTGRKSEVDHFSAIGLRNHDA